MIKDELDYRSTVALLNLWTEAYDKGEPKVSDEEWDNLYFSILKYEQENGLENTNSPTQKIEYEVVNSLPKVTHNHFMASAAKTKDWNEFLKYFSDIDSTKDIIGMLKLDGLTCSLRYVNNNLVSAETRGNGEVGEDITHNAKVIKSIPNRIAYKGELILDGEIICTEKDFEPFSSDYKNPRNFAAGSIRLLDSRECASRNLTFIVWNVVKGFEDEPSFYNRLTEAEKLGFKVVPSTTSIDCDAKEYLLSRAKELSYPIDGLIGRFDDVTFGESLGNTSHHLNCLYAFKFYDEEYETNLIDIDYKVSRNGEMVPVAFFDPIEIDGSVVSRASLHNLSILEELNNGIMRRGDKLWITKRNQIIPNCEKWEHSGEGILIKYPKICPFCGEPTSIHTSDTGVKQLFCDNKSCDSRLTNKIDHYCGKKGMDIKGLSSKTIEKLIDLKWLNSIKDLYSLREHRDEWVKLPGFGAASVDKILSAIEGSKNNEMWQFISALGIPLVGVTVAKQLSKEFSSWEDFKDNGVKGSKFAFEHLEGFGPEMNRALKTFDYTEADEIAAMLSLTKVEEKVSDNKTAEGLVFVITGKVNSFKNRDELKSYIESIGGKVGNSITSKTNYLINNDVNSTSSKNQKAKSLGVPIIAEDEFLAAFGQN